MAWIGLKKGVTAQKGLDSFSSSPVADSDTSGACTPTPRES
jgi:hypothetical protein